MGHGRNQKKTRIARRNPANEKTNGVEAIIVTEITEGNDLRQDI